MTDPKANTPSELAKRIEAEADRFWDEIHKYGAGPYESKKWLRESYRRVVHDLESRLAELEGKHAHLETVLDQSRLHVAELEAAVRETEEAWINDACGLCRGKHEPTRHITHGWWHLSTKSRPSDVRCLASTVHERRWDTR